MTNQPASLDPTARDLRLCLRHMTALTASEGNFVRGVATRSGVSPKQAEVLRRIADMLRDRGCK